MTIPMTIQSLFLKTNTILMIFLLGWVGSLSAQDETCSECNNKENKDDNGLSPLLQAVWDNNLEEVDRLLSYGAEDIHVINNLNQNCLVYASEKGDGDLFEYLLSRGVNVDAKDNMGRTPLFYAAWHGNLEAATKLIQYNASIEARDLFQRTPLFSAVWAVQIEIVKLLLMQGAEVNVLDRYHETPFFGAITSGNKEIIDMLLQYGANPEAHITGL